MSPLLAYVLGDATALWLHWGPYAVSAALVAWIGSDAVKVWREPRRADREED